MKAVEDDTIKYRAANKKYLDTASNNVHTVSKELKKGAADRLAGHGELEEDNRVRWACMAGCVPLPRAPDLRIHSDQESGSRRGRPQLRAVEAAAVSGHRSEGREPQHGQVAAEDGWNCSVGKEQQRDRQHQGDGK